ncbi:uncharacterized protein LOC115230710 [Octopus sinensis]|uniref:Uncharacterized protein LOC115230710 n=1 Tax=Octopus sinensis TaxID=2607531 RepID=A0A6P7TY61_9MOLL|nr:uncharacterized protein LOC115230710 [Octopus sinensis]
MPRVSAYNRFLVIEKLKCGESQVKISKDLGISRCAIQKIKKRFLHGYLYKDMPKKGRNKKLTKNDERYAIRMSKLHPKMTANDLLICCNFSGKVSLSTIKRILRRSNLFGRIAVKKPKLTASQVDKRYTWCLTKIPWNQDDWNLVIFSYECRIQLNQMSRQYIRRPPGSKLQKEYSIETVKFPFINYEMGSN